MSRALALLRRHWPFGLVLAFVVASRLWFALSFPIVQISDYASYYAEARGLAGLGPLDWSATYAIGPKLFFAPFFLAFGDGLRVIGVVNTFVYAAALALFYAGALAAFGHASAVLAAAVCAISLSELYFVNLVSTEVLGTFFVAAIFCLMSRGLASWPVTLALGAVGGLAVYNRSNILPMGALAFAYALLTLRRPGAALARGAAVQAVTLLVTLPLCAFNDSHFGRFVPIIAHAENLWYGNNPRLSGDFHTNPPLPEHFPPGSSERARLRREYSAFYVNPDPAMDLGRLGPYASGDVAVAYALGWISHNKLRFAQLVWARFQLFFFSCTYGEVPYRVAYARDDPRQPRWRPDHERLMASARLPVRRLYQVLIAGAALGLLATLARDRAAFFSSPHVLPLLIVAYYSAPFLVSVAANRYHVPVLPLCWLYLAHGLVLLGRSVGGRAAPTPEAAG